MESLINKELFLKYRNQGKDFFDNTSLDGLRSSVRFSEFQGVFFRSTMELSLKLLLIDSFNTIENIDSLIRVFKNTYDVADIKMRNEIYLREWYNP